MTDFERWQEVKAIVQEALDRPENERASYLDEACRGDEELSREVEALLAVSSARADFFDNYQALPPGLRRPELAEGEIVGHYRITRPLGEGGMGRVYLAEDSEVSRRVALKILPRRLTQEQELHARLQHQNIAVFFDSGTTRDGFGYFAMEYIEGEPITAYCERQALSVEECLTLFLQVCDAVSFAHRNLVVHRDIKPSNILIAADGRLKLLDFGIAKLLPTNADLLTLTRPEERSLTIAFASPEQLEGERTTTATDIYSLGVLLCLLLTGRLPYPVQSYQDLPWAIRNMEPEKPSQLILKNKETTTDEGLSPSSTIQGSRKRFSRRLRGDLDAIILRALRKEPQKRYQTVTELADDIRRFLNDEPVSAVKGSGRYKAWKFCKKHTGSVIGTAVAVLVVIGLLIGLFMSQRETARQRDQAQDVARILNDVFTTDNPWNTTGDQITAREMLDHASREISILSLDPTRKATALYTLGTLYARLGIYPEAKSLLSESLNLRKRHLGAIHDDTILAENALGGVLYFLAEYTEAERLLRHAESALRTRPSQQGERVSTLTNLARVYFEQGKPAQAESLEREALRLLDTTGQAESKEAAELHSHLGLTLTRLDRLPEAEKHHRQSLVIRTRLFGPDHPTTANAHHNLALNLNSQDKYAEAEQHYRKALAIARKSLPRENPFIPAILDSLASTCAHQRRFAEAEALLREALALKRQILPKDHPAIPLSTINLASIIVSSDIDRLPEVEPLYREGIATFRKLAGDRSREVGISLYTYGRALLEHEEPLRAKPTLEEAARTLREVDGPDHIETALTERAYARALLELNEAPAAEPLLMNAVRVFRERQPPDGFELAKTIALLGRCRLRLQEFDSADRDLHEAYDLFSRFGKLSSPEGKDLLSQLAVSREHSRREASRVP